MILRTALFSLLLIASTGSVAGEDGAAIYAESCASCHGPDRLGGTGPALIPQTLKRMRGPKLKTVISEGRTATQMPAFADSLAPSEIVAVAAFLITPVEPVPAWTKQDIEASRKMAADYTRKDKPVFQADPLNLFLVVETGDHHVSVIDGDKFKVLDRFATPFAVHGGPKFTPEGRFVFIMSRDGWVQKYDLWSLAEVGRVRAGLNSRNIAISRDGRWLAVANYLPNTLTILAADDLSVKRIFQIADKDGTPSRVSAVYQARPRNSFVLALKDVPEVWEISTDPNAEPVYEGYVHSHEKGMVEAVASSVGLFARRRIAVEEPIDDFFFDPGYDNLMGTTRGGDKGVVVNLIVGRPIAELPLPGMPHLGSGISWLRDGTRVMATPHLREARISVIDVGDWSVVKTIKTAGPGFFLRSHANSRYLWADVFFGPNKDKMHVIDKQTLNIVKTLQPVPDATVAHVEFDRHGRHALVSVWEQDGAVIVYNAETLEEVRRLPMVKPSGKYNVWNKISFSDGTSH